MLPSSWKSSRAANKASGRLMGALRSCCGLRSLPGGDLVLKPHQQQQQDHQHLFGMKEEESAKQQEKEEVNPINNITNMFINKIIYTHLRGRRSLPSSKMRRWLWPVWLWSPTCSSPTLPSLETREEESAKQQDGEQEEEKGAVLLGLLLPCGACTWWWWNHNQLYPVWNHDYIWCNQP